MTSKEIAEHFGVTPQTILVWRKTEGLPWYEEKASKEYGSRRRIFFNMKKVNSWAKARGKKLKVVRMRIRQYRATAREAAKNARR